VEVAPDPVERGRRPVRLELAARHHGEQREHLAEQRAARECACAPSG
jgi:hypothetical protein